VVFAGQVVGSCKEQEWKICPIVEDWVGTIVVVDVAAIVARIVALAAFAVEACQSAAVPSAVVAAAAFAVEAYQFAVEPTVFARKDFESHLETSFVAMG